MKIMVFLVPAAILLVFGIIVINQNVRDYNDTVQKINTSDRLCDGKSCICSSMRCVTLDDISIQYDAIAFGITFIVSSAIIILVYFIRYHRTSLRKT